MIETYFDVIKVLGKEEYNDVSALDKSRHIFMVNRHLARVFPEISATLSGLRIDSSNAMDVWHSVFKNFLKAGRNPLPNAINYAKLSPPKKGVKYDQECIEFMVSKLRLGSADLKTIKELKGEDLIKYLDSIKNLLNENTNVKKK